jgi:hypothetical protein
MSSNFPELERFRLDVLANPDMQRTLRETDDQERFVELLVSLGSERGYRFTAPEVEEALRTSWRSWIERWID